MGTLFLEQRDCGAKEKKKKEVTHWSNGKSMALG